MRDIIKKNNIYIIEIPEKEAKKNKNKKYLKKYGQKISKLDKIHEPTHPSISTNSKKDIFK